MPDSFDKRNDGTTDAPLPKKEKSLLGKNVTRILGKLQKRTENNTRQLLERSKKIQSAFEELEKDANTRNIDYKGADREEIENLVKATFASIKVELDEERIETRESPLAESTKLYSELICKVALVSKDETCINFYIDIFNYKVDNSIHVVIYNKI